VESNLYSLDSISGSKDGEVVKSGELGKILYYDSTRVNLGLFQRDVNVIADLPSTIFQFLIICWASIRRPFLQADQSFPGTPENLAYITLFYDSGAIAHSMSAGLRQLRSGRSS